MHDNIIKDLSHFIIDTLPQKIFCKDLQFKYLFCNKEYAYDLKLPPEKIRGKTDYDLFSKEMAEKYRRDDEEILRQNAPLHIEEMYVKNGKESIVHTYKVPLQDTTGAVIGILGVFWDITHHRKIENQLEKSEKEYRELVETANSIILRMDTKGNVTYFNKFAEDFFGYRREEIVGKNVVGTIVPKTESTGRDLKIMIENIGKNTPAYANNENENIRKNGRRVWVAWTNKGIYDQHGNHIETLCIGNDITKLKKTEQELQSSRLKYHNMIESSPESIVVLDKKGVVISCNSMAEKISGYKKTELIGKHFAKTGGFRTKDLPRLFILFRKAKKGVFPDSLEIECIRKDSSTVTMEVRGSLLEDGYIQLIATDISERKKSREKLQAAYEEIKKTQQELIQAEKMAAMGQLSAGISHELNQPLTGIRGLAQIGLRKLNNGQDIETHLNQIIEQTDRMERIIKNVRFFARRSEFSLKRIDIRIPLLDAISLIEKQFSMKNIIIKKHIVEGLPCIHGDTNQLQQVFLNLFTNARDAIEDRLPTKKGEITVKTVFDGPARQIKVTFGDNGCGIEKDSLRFVMNPFYTTKSPQKGTGLGLAIVYRIIEQHHGTIKIKSKKGIGTSVYITLPIYTPRPKARRRKR
ncbi:MAG: PAS domain S-box protein [Candidatus Omnitrophica bacterium]|nr:PAS domain S-box protein [Candidatus Omnitrophota bacterium]